MLFSYLLNHCIIGYKVVRQIYTQLEDIHIQTKLIILPGSFPFSMFKYEFTLNEKSPWYFKIPTILTVVCRGFKADLFFFQNCWVYLLLNQFSYISHITTCLFIYEGKIKIIVFFFLILSFSRSAIYECVYIYEKNFFPIRKIFSI